MFFVFGVTGFRLDTKVGRDPHERMILFSYAFTITVTTTVTGVDRVRIIHDPCHKRKEFYKVHEKFGNENYKNDVKQTF